MSRKIVEDVLGRDMTREIWSGSDLEAFVPLRRSETFNRRSSGLGRQTISLGKNALRVEGPAQTIGGLSLISWKNTNGKVCTSGQDWMSPQRLTSLRSLDLTPKPARTTTTLGLRSVGGSNRRIWRRERLSIVLSSGPT